MSLELDQSGNWSFRADHVLCTEIIEKTEYIEQIMNYPFYLLIV